MIPCLFIFSMSFPSSTFKCTPSSRETRIAFFCKTISSFLWNRPIKISRPTVCFVFMGHPLMNGEFWGLFYAFSFYVLFPFVSLFCLSIGFHLKWNLWETTCVRIFTIPKIEGVWYALKRNLPNRKKYPFVFPSWKMLMDIKTYIEDFDSLRYFELWDFLGIICMQIAFPFIPFLLLAF